MNRRTFLGSVAALALAPFAGIAKAAGHEPIDLWETYLPRRSLRDLHDDYNAACLRIWVQSRGKFIALERALPAR